MKGSKTLASATLKNGVAKFTLKLSKGKNTLKAVYAGERRRSRVPARRFTIKQK